MPVPNTDALKRLIRRVRFTDGDLKRLEIDKAALIPFILEPDHLRHISDHVVGETPLEFYPLMANQTGIVVVSPPNISLAVRAVLVGAAQTGGMESALLSRMLQEQQKASEISGFWPLPSLRLSPPNQYFMRASMSEFSPGRFLQVIQVPVTFDEFPRQAFGSVRRLGDEASRFIADDIARFWEFLRSQPEYRQGVTVLLLSGWGTPHSVAPPLDEANAPAGWLYLPLSFAAASVLGMCENGKFRDVIRILEQVDRLEADGFSFQNVNGILNLFGHWQTTDGNLIPEHMSEIEPPCNLILPTDELLAPRVEAARKRDVRALPLVEGGFKTVQRLDWNSIDDLQPIYASIEDAAEGRLIGAVFIDGRTWWFECSSEAASEREKHFRLWHAVLQWIATVSVHIIGAFPAAFPTSVCRVEISIPSNSAFERIEPSGVGESTLAESLSGEPGSASTSAKVRVSDMWLRYLNKPENDAEVELVAAILEQIAVSNPTPPSRAELRIAVLDSIGSKDWRWLHAREVRTPLDQMTALGLVGPFTEMRLSAHALVTCDSIWAFRERSDGLEITGVAECQQFLHEYRESILDSLIADIRRMDRKKLMLACAQNYQSARAEQSQWRATIKAMRAIHGTSADVTAFKRQNATNAVQRASKSVCEIAACEASASGGLNPGQPDLEELFARALLLFSNGQLFASIRAGLMQPTLKISPAGDLLSDRSVYEAALRPPVELTNRKILDEAAEAYARMRTREGDRKSEDKLPWDDGLRKAVEAEYRGSAEAFVDLQYAIIQIAEARGNGTFVMKRSELTRLLSASEFYPSDEPNAMLERLTLPRRSSWKDRSSGITEADINLSRFDRPFSIINRPLLAMDDEADPLVLVAPTFVSDAMMYSLSGLMNGSLNNQFWVSAEAKAYAGAQGHAEGEKFEDSVAEKLTGLGLETWRRCKLSWALNEKVDDKLGNIDVLAVSPDRRRVWVIEAKNLKLCRTEAEVAARLSEYRGRTLVDKEGREAPDKMLRHIQRVEYLRKKRSALCARLKLETIPEVHGLLIVDAPQPMNFYMLGQLKDGQSAFLDAIKNFAF
jgi:hypothetical protein